MHSDLSSCRAVMKEVVNSRIPPSSLCASTVGRLSLLDSSLGELTEMAVFAVVAIVQLTAILAY